jgi:flagellar hook-length control protein FliK
MAEVVAPGERLAAGAQRLISPSLQVGPGPLSFTPSTPGSSPEPVLRLLGGGERAPAAGAAQAGASPLGSPLSAPAGVLAAASPASGSAAPLASPGWVPDGSGAAAGAAWVRPLSEHVLSMVQQGPQVMRLRLDPPELGGLEISLSLSQEQTNVTFTAQHQFARDLIEAGLPRLRELLAQGGLSLGDFSVAADAGGGEGDGSRARWTAGQDGSARLTAEEEASGLEPASAWAASLRHGLVDDYA